MTLLSTTHDRTPTPDDYDLCGLFETLRRSRDQAEGKTPRIRIDAKRQALDALENARLGAAKNGDGNGNGKDDGNGNGPNHPTRAQIFRCSSRSPRGSRHRHVTVCG
jgi:hypothetical protein